MKKPVIGILSLLIFAPSLLVRAQIASKWKARSSAEGKFRILTPVWLILAVLLSASMGCVTAVRVLMVVWALTICSWVTASRPISYHCSPGLSNGSLNGRAISQEGQ